MFPSMEHRNVVLLLILSDLLTSLQFFRTLRLQNPFFDFFQVFFHYSFFHYRNVQVHVVPVYILHVLICVPTTEIDTGTGTRTGSRRDYYQLFYYDGIDR